MKTIYKYTIKSDAGILMPKDGKILSVQMQHNEPQVWVLVDPTAPKEIRFFETFGTGRPIEDDTTLRYIGTFQMSGGFLVFHLFERCISAVEA